jgi:hypothetical protein
LECCQTASGVVGALGRKYAKMFSEGQNICISHITSIFFFLGTHVLGKYIKINQYIFLVIDDWHFHTISQSLLFNFFMCVHLLE